MRLSSACALAAIAALSQAAEISTADGRKTRTQDVELKRVADDLCFFKNFNDYWCLKATPPMLKTGWTWA